MKKLICLFLSLVMVLGLCACSGGSEEARSESKETTAETTAPEAASGLLAGYARTGIVPDYQVQLAGGAATRLSEAYAQDDLCITCVALQEGGETFLLFTMDVICAEDVFVDPAKALISQTTGVPEENILMNATHTHAGPAIRSNGSKNVDQYRADFFVWAEETAKEAIKDLYPATVSYGSIEAPGMAWVRHYEMNDGTYYGANFGSSASGIKGHVEDADVELQLIRFTRDAKEGKKDIVMMNFPAHATMTQSDTALSADFPAPARLYVEQEENCHVAYFIAAAGNQVPTSRVASEQFSDDYRVYGEELGRYAVMGLSNMTEAENTGFGFVHRTFTAGYNKEKLDMLPKALEVQTLWNTVGRASSEGSKAAKEAGFASIYEVSAIISRAKAEDTNSMEIKVLQIGDIGFIFAPYEMFGSHGKSIKEDSPYDMTFIITCAEGAEGYLPSYLGWEIGTYESHVSKFERGTGEKLVEEFVSMLTEMKNR